MPTLHLLRVFCSEDGSGGNALGVFLDGAEVAPEPRQAIAADLGLSETVFVDDAERGAIQIFTPEVELDFAGHPTVGTAWLLEGADVLRVAAGELAVRRDGELVYVSARPEWGPPHEFAELPSPDEVDALEGPPGGHDLLTVWSWIDESAGVVRARAFLERLGIAEDEATGSAATKLCAQLERPIDIRQGRSSRILARPGEDGLVEIGGRSVLDDVRDYAPP
jgi:predicted PhzF superfamily epimerase YddE/YHI9